MRQISFYDIPKWKCTLDIGLHEFDFNYYVSLQDGQKDLCAYYHPRYNFW